MSLTQLEEYVLTYKDDTGNIVCNLPDYYRLFVMPLDEKFTYFYLSPTQLALCPLHDDHDPSLGLIKDKQHEGVYIYHCFGCGKTGNIIRFHQFIESLYHNRELTIKESCFDLCKLFDIPEPDLNTFDDDDYEAMYTSKLRRVRKVSRGYTSTDFSRELLDIRKAGTVDLDKVNKACIKLIATKKGLYKK